MVHFYQVNFRENFFLTKEANFWSINILVINVKDNDVRLMWSDIGISENIYSAIGICIYQVFWNGQEPWENGNNLHYFLEYLRTRFWLLILHSLPLVAFYTLWNHKKTRVFLVFSRSIERDRWHKIWYFCSSTFSANWERRDKTRTTTEGKVKFVYSREIIC